MFTPVKHIQKEHPAHTSSHARTPHRRWISWHHYELEQGSRAKPSLLATGSGIETDKAQTLRAQDDGRGQDFDAQIMR
jgi:hypothetical protein